MGVNDKGVVIGNEAVFTRNVDRKGVALLGMDLLRLGLERGDDALHALSVITEHLERYGQAGPAGYRDGRFRYDNSFIIADSQSAWILETAGQHWVAKKVHQYAALSNYLTITSDYDMSSPGVEDFACRKGWCKKNETFSFAKAFDTWFVPYFGGAHKRRSMNLSNFKYLPPDNTLGSMAQNLRSHNNKSTDFSKHNNTDICFHAGGIHRPHQTCGSMLVGLSRGKSADILVTATSAPCISIFKPIGFDDKCYFSDHEKYQGSQLSVWHEFERIHRLALFDIDFRRDLQESRDLVEKAMFDDYSLMNHANTGIDGKVREWHATWLAAAGRSKINTNSWHPYHRFWRKTNRLDSDWLK